MSLTDERKRHETLDRAIGRAKTIGPASVRHDGNSAANKRRMTDARGRFVLNSGGPGRNRIELPGIEFRRCVRDYAYVSFG
jgi:hypothetical protein